MREYDEPMLPFSDEPSSDDLIELAPHIEARDATEESEALQDALEARDKELDSLADKLGSYTLAKVRLGITDDEDTPSTLTPKFSKKTSSPRHSRRGGRSYPEPSDSDLDPYWNPPYNDKEPTEEEKRASHRGAELARAVSAFSKEESIQKLSSEEREQAVNKFIEDFRRNQDISE